MHGSHAMHMPQRSFAVVWPYTCAKIALYALSIVQTGSQTLCLVNLNKSTWTTQAKHKVPVVVSKAGYKVLAMPVRAKVGP